MPDRLLVLDPRHLRTIMAPEAMDSILEAASEAKVDTEAVMEMVVTVAAEMEVMEAAEMVVTVAVAVELMIRYR